MTLSKLCSYDVAQSIARRTIYVKSNVVCRSGFSWRWIKYRISKPVLLVYYKLFKILNPGVPWTTPASVKIFSKLLNKEMTGLEYGSGRSTLFLASRMKSLVSIEHDELWYERVQKAIADKGVTNVDYHLIPRNQTGANEMKRAFLGKLEQEKDVCFRPEYFDYFQFVARFPDNYFDFILVDGRARVECIFNSIEKLKSPGIVVLDNSDRERYWPAMELLDQYQWPSVHTTNGLFDTMIWFKP